MPYEQRQHTAESPKRPGSLTLEGRKHLTVSGVEEVMSFDEREIEMRTGDGDLTVRGEGMSISELSAGGGDLHVRGRITVLCYADAAPERNLWARLFR